MFFSIKNIYLSVKDISQEPKQIEISELEFLTRHTSGKGRRNYYYLVGEVNGKREKIEIKPRDSD